MTAPPPATDPAPAYRERAAAHHAAARGTAIAAGLALAAVVAAHARVRARARWCYRLAEVCEQGEARVLRRWDRLDITPVAVPDDHPYAADLSLTGRASLWQLLGTVSA